jgi:hypothetical protein
MSPTSAAAGDDAGLETLTVLIRDSYFGSFRAKATLDNSIEQTTVKVNSVIQVLCSRVMFASMRQVVVGSRYSWPVFATGFDYNTPRR